jgi:hypothetical protein
VGAPSSPRQNSSSERSRNWRFQIRGQSAGATGSVSARLNEEDFAREEIHHFVLPACAAHGLQMLPMDHIIH